MRELLNTLKGLPLIVKLILCIPAVDIVWSVARLLSGIDKKDTVRIIIGALTIFPGAFFVWVLDLVWILTKGDALFVE